MAKHRSKPCALHADLTKRKPVGSRPPRPGLVSAELKSIRLGRVVYFEVLFKAPVPYFCSDHHDMKIQAHADPHRGVAIGVTRLHGNLAD